MKTDEGDENTLKMLYLYLGPELFTFYFSPSSESNSRKCAKIYTIIHAYSNIKKKNFAEKSVARKFGVVCLCFDRNG